MTEDHLEEVQLIAALCLHSESQFSIHSFNFSSVPSARTFDMSFIVNFVKFFWKSK